MCQRPCGCPIEDLASDFELNQFLAEFSQARGLYEMNKIESLLERSYERLGLLDDPDLLFELEKIFIEGMNKRAREQNQQKDASKWNRIR